MNAESLRDALRPVYGGRKWILLASAKAGLVGLVDELAALGASRPFCLANIAGTGPIPDPEQAAGATFGLDATDIIDGFRVYEAALGDPPAEVRAAVDRWDPAGEAQGLGRIVLGPVPTVAGRRRWAARPPSWIELEDKVALESVWDELGLPHVRAPIVPAEEGALRAAAASVDRGLGTAWVGDAREGVHGGGVYLRWVRSEADVAEAVAFFAASCDRVRVQPFLEGIPCSIHAIVFPDDVAVFRPVEMVALRRPGRSRLFYTGCATYWDPSDADREEMRAFARRAAEGLRATRGYRGTFTIDGILTDEGFRPTELNARVGAGLSLFEVATDGAPLALLAFALQEEVELPVDPRELEAFVLEAADAKRAAHTIALTDERPADTTTLSLARAGDAWRVRGEDEPGEPDATALYGPSDAAGFLRFKAEPAVVPVGPSYARFAASALMWADREMGLGIGPLEPARDVRA